MGLRLHLLSHLHTFFSTVRGLVLTSNDARRLLFRSWFVCVAAPRSFSPLEKRPNPSWVLQGSTGIISIPRRGEQCPVFITEITIAVLRVACFLRTMIDFGKAKFHSKHSWKLCPLLFEFYFSETLRIGQEKSNFPKRKSESSLLSVAVLQSASVSCFLSSQYQTPTTIKFLLGAETGLSTKIPLCCKSRLKNETSDLWNSLKLWWGMSIVSGIFMTLITSITAMLIAIFRSNKLLISSCMTVQLNYERMSSDLGMLMPEEC